MELTDKEFWEGFWKSPGGRSSGGISYFTRTFSKKLLEYGPPGSSALEVGCGGSVWLPILATHGVDAWGIDYSDVGVDLLNQNLARHKARATVVKGNIFDLAALPTARFDLVFSLGLVEHFTDTAPLVQRFRDLCKPGGTVITVVPNFGGFWGRVQQRVDRNLFEAHRLYDPPALDRVHTDIGLVIGEPARYWGGISPLVINYSRLLRKLPIPVVHAALAAAWLGQQALCWTTALLPQRVRNPPRLAGHLMGVYRRPADGHRPSGT
jgi:SAM-dependent methyltransferase